MKKLSVVVPCYNEEDVLEKFYETVNDILKGEDFEFVFVDDGSKDSTLSIMRKLSLNNNVRYLSFSKNFGKEAAMYAGLEHATGKYVVVMDADLQHDPKLLPEMLRILEEGKCNNVSVRRKKRKQGLRGILSTIFFKIMAKLSGLNTKEGEMDYRMMDRKMVDAILKLKEYHRFTKGIFNFVGYDTVWLEQEDIERSLGVTKWTFKSLFKYSIEGITAFSTMPLVFASFLGILSILGSIIWFICLLVMGKIESIAMIICSIFFVGGVILFSLGLMGEYIARMYIEVKNRPIYLVKETSEDD